VSQRDYTVQSKLYLKETPHYEIRVISERLLKHHITDTPQYT